MWWDIVKSPRDEAYSKFLEEFGPGFEIWRLDRHGIEFRENRLIGNEWLIHMDNMGDITFYSEKYRPYLGFVEGMFVEEYPERYNEIGDLLQKLILEERKVIIDRPNKLPDFRNMSSSDRAKWLKEHDFCYLANGNFVMAGVRNYLVGSLVSYYEQLDSEEVTDLFSSTTDRVSNYIHDKNILELFYAYQQYITNNFWNATRKIATKLRTTTGRFEVLEDILDGSLRTNSFHREHFGRNGGVTIGIRRRIEEE
jgi:hypothetical protein